MWKATLDDGVRIMHFNTAIYGLNAIKKAAYAFDVYFYVLIEQQENMTTVRLIPKDCCQAPGQFVDEFCNEVFNQELRERVNVEMAGIRNLLLARALTKQSRLDRASHTIMRAALC